MTRKIVKRSTFFTSAHPSLYRRFLHCTIFLLFSYRKLYFPPCIHILTVVHVTHSQNLYTQLHVYTVDLRSHFLCSFIVLIKYIFSFLFLSVFLSLNPKTREWMVNFQFSSPFNSPPPSHIHSLFSVTHIYISMYCLNMDRFSNDKCIIEVKRIHFQL